MKKDLVSFLDIIDGLKRVRRVRTSRRKNEFESMADHTFMMAILAWLFGSKKKGEIDVERMIKLELVHEFAKASMGDDGPYEHLFSKGRKRVADMVGKWPELSKAERDKIHLARHKADRKRVEKITSFLAPGLRDEILGLWLEYEECSSNEGRFANQLGALENLIQALEHKEDDPGFDIGPWLFHAKKMIDDPVLLDFVSVLEGRGKAMEGEKKGRVTDKKKSGK